MVDIVAVLGVVVTYDVDSFGAGTGLLDFGSFAKPRGKFRASLWVDEPVAFLGTYHAAGYYVIGERHDVAVFVGNFHYHVCQRFGFGQLGYRRIYAMKNIVLPDTGTRRLPFYLAMEEWGRKT